MLSPCIKWAEPGVAWYNDEFTDTSKRDSGTRVHVAIDAIANGQEATVQDSDELVLVNYAYGYLQELRNRFTVRTEVAVAINIRTGEAEVLWDVKSRNYPELGPDWLFGTADLLATSEDKKTIYIGDWKTGGSDGADLQLKSLLYGFVRSFDNQELPRPTTKLISCLSLNEHGCWPDEREVTDAELEEHFNALQQAYFKSQTKGNPEVPGIHCTTLYCPHLAYCQSHRDTIEDLARLDSSQNKRSLPMAASLHGQEVRMLTDKPQSMKEAAQTMSRLTAANRVVKYLTECMKQYVKNGGRIIDGTMEWGPGNDGFRWRKIKDSNHVK